MLFLIVTLSAAPLVDLLTGFLLSKNDLAEGALGSPSQLLRGLALIFGLTTALPVLKGVRRAPLLLFSLMVLSEVCAYVLWHGQLSYIRFGLSWASRILFLAIVAWHVERVVRFYGVHKLTRIAALGLTIVATNVVGSFLFSFGRSTYGDGSSVKGFIASGNAIGLVLVVGGLFLAVMAERFQLKYGRTIAFFVWLSSPLVGTKGVLVFLVLGVAYYLFIMAKKLSGPALICLALLTGIVLGTIVLGTPVFATIFRRFHEWEGSLTYFLGYRNVYFQNALDAFVNSRLNDLHFLVRTLLGGGAYGSWRTESFDLSDFDTLESDLSDIGFMYGLVGLAGFAYFWWDGFRRSCHRDARFLRVLWVMFFLYSALAGHSLFNGLSATYIALCYGCICGLSTNSRHRTVES